MGARVAALLRFTSGVRVRLTLWYLAILAVVFFVFSGVVITATLNNAENEEHANLLSMANQLASTYDATTGKLVFDYPWGQGAVAEGIARTVDKQVAPLGPFDVALLLDPQGGVVQQFGPVAGDGLAQLQELVSKWRSLGAPYDFGDAVSLPVSSNKDGQTTVSGDAQYRVYFASVRGQGGGSRDR
jgi:hypothetical protein